MWGDEKLSPGDLLWLVPVFGGALWPFAPWVAAIVAILAVLAAAVGLVWFVCKAVYEVWWGIAAYLFWVERKTAWLRSGRGN
jgi:hypothetical protein